MEGRQTLTHVQTCGSYMKQSSLLSRPHVARLPHKSQYKGTSSHSQMVGRKRPEAFCSWLGWLGKIQSWFFLPLRKAVIFYGEAPDHFRASRCSSSVNLAHLFVPTVVISQMDRGLFSPVKACFVRMKASSKRKHADMQVTISLRQGR